MRDKQNSRKRDLLKLSRNRLVTAQPMAVYDAILS